MVFYKPITDFEETAALFPDKILPQGFVYGAYRAIENGVCKGKCLVMVDDFKCYVGEISADNDDALICEGLIRASLNFAANRNAYMAYCKTEKYKDIMSLMGFSLKNGVYEGDIPTLLLGSCCKNTEKVDIKPQ